MKNKMILNPFNEKYYFLLDQTIMDIRNLSPVWYGVLHLVVAVLAIVVPPLLLQNHVGDVTVSAVVLGFINWLEQKTAK